MIVRFRKSAIADLDRITRWYDGIAPESTARILADIERSIERLQAYPRSGAPTGIGDLRRSVSLRYHFKIAYLPWPDHIEIVGVFRYQNRKV